MGKTEFARALATALGRPLFRLQCYEGLDEAKALYEWEYAKQLLYTQILKDKIGETLSGATTLAEAADRIAAADAVFFSERFLLPRPVLQALLSPQPALLLVDEIDKADPEFEAFLLEVLADCAVTIPELGTIKATRHAPGGAHLQRRPRAVRRAPPPLPAPPHRLPRPASASCASSAHGLRRSPAALAAQVVAAVERLRATGAEEATVDQRDPRLGAEPGAAQRRDRSRPSWSPRRSTWSSSTPPTWRRRGEPARRRSAGRDRAGRWHARPHRAPAPRAGGAGGAPRARPERPRWPEAIRCPGGGAGRLGGAPDRGGAPARPGRRGAGGPAGAGQRARRSGCSSGVRGSCAWVLRSAAGESRTDGEHEAELRPVLARASGAAPEELHRRLRRFKARDALRLAARDVWLGLPMETLGREQSALAEGLIRAALPALEAALRRRYGAPEPEGFVVLGLGKLGGDDLNWSSDVDLIYVYRGEGTTAGGSAGALPTVTFYTRLAEALTRALSSRHRGRLLLPRRPRPPSPRARRRGGHLAPGDAPVLRAGGPHLGARGAGEGADGRRRCWRCGEELLRSSPLRLAAHARPGGGGGAPRPEEPDRPPQQRPGGAT